MNKSQYTCIPYTYHQFCMGRTQCEALLTTPQQAEAGSPTRHRNFSLQKKMTRSLVMCMTALLLLLCNPMIIEALSHAWEVKERPRKRIMGVVGHGFTRAMRTTKVYYGMHSRACCS